MRLFIAVNPPEVDRATLWRATEPLRRQTAGVRWVGAERLHVTLKFIGATAADRVPEIAAATERIAGRHGPARLEMSGLGAFPSLRRPRVFWVGLERAEPLAAIHRDLEEALCGIGIARDERSFRAHVTIGRVGRDTAREPLRRIADRAERLDVRIPFDAASLDLMRSHPGRGGPRYERLRRLDLAG